MSSAEISQCILDIKSWFDRTKAKKLINGPATTVDIQRLEKTIDTPLPSAVKILLQVANGGMYFLDKKQVSTEEIKELVGDSESLKTWKNGLVPIAGDSSSMIVIDTAGKDEVFEWDSDDGLGDRLAVNVTRFFENYRNDLLAGRYEYLDEIGVVEKMEKGRK